MADDFVSVTCVESVFVLNFYSHCDTPSTNICGLLSELRLDFFLALSARLVFIAPCSHAIEIFSAAQVREFAGNASRMLIKLTRVLYNLRVEYMLSRRMQYQWADRQQKMNVKLMGVYELKELW
jgi:hypothetical protein